MTNARASDVATVGEALARHAASRPHAPLLIAPETGRILTYGELERLTRKLAAFLDQRGLPPGSTIALHLHNGYQTTALFIGLMAAGYVVAPLNLLSLARELAWVLEHCETRLVFTCAEHATVLEKAVDTLEREPERIVIDIDSADVFPDIEPVPALSRPSPSDIGLLMYTSGTTGTPKGVLLSHANLLASAHTVADWHQLTARDRVLSSLPLYHINGQVIATLTPFLSGGSIVAPHRFSVHQWWDLVAQHECTWINMVPTIIAYLLTATEARSFPSVRFGRSASAPLPPEQHRAFEERFGIPVIEAMGMTECASIVFCNPHDDRRRYGSPGLPCGVEAGVIDKTGRHLGTGEAGEIVLRGPNVMAGYFKSPEKTAETIDENGWLRTGDLGKRDEDGFYFITGRLKELIIKGGENIAPRDIDEALLRHPAIMEAAAVGVPHPAYGQDVAAAIVLHPGARFDRDEFARWCEEELGRFRAPTCVRVVKEMPKGPSGKVQRLKLVQLFVDDEITATKRDDRPNA